MGCCLIPWQGGAWRSQLEPIRLQTHEVLAVIIKGQVIKIK